MPFTMTRPLTSILDEEAPARCARAIADAAGDRLVLNTQRNTPIDRSPHRDKPKRPRGTLRKSIERTGVERTGLAYRVRALTRDPIAPYVEFDTKPHIIRPRKPGGSLRWRSARGVHFAGAVRHPGTKGQHMFALGALKTKRERAAVSS